MVARAHRRADESWSSAHLGNAPEPRPLLLFGGAFAGGGLLVGPYEGGIEHQVLVLGIINESSEHPLPHPFSAQRVKRLWMRGRLPIDAKPASQK